jgi:hypothetical protein
MGIAVPTTGFRRFMFFNRFAVDRDDGFVHIQFGCVNKANALIDAYATAISELELAGLRKSTMDYLGGQGTLLDAPPLWQPPASITTELANHIVMARHGNLAETVFYCFSFWSALEASKRAAALRETKKPQEDMGVIAEPMALLRSPLRAQQHLIRLLFPASEPLLTNE